MNTKRSAFAVVGVTHVTDLYPNVKYKLALLQEFAHPAVQVYDLGENSFAQVATRARLLVRAGFALRFLWAHWCIFSKALLRPASVVYIPYPAVPILLFYSIWPVRKRPRLLADAFISLYDSIVLDRGLLARPHWLARLLFRVERRAFLTADVVIVDTAENGAHYAELFGIAATRFIDLALSVPPLPLLPARPARQLRFRCLFMGSMVPLQGVMTILQAALLLKDRSDIEFRIIGTGQEAPLVEAFLAEHPGIRVTWASEIQATTSLIQEIREADLCLGIFGSSAKAERVLPYKLYYYAILGRPFVTRRSATLQRIAPWQLQCENTPDALAERIQTLSQDMTQLNACTDAARALGRTLGDKHQLASRLRELLNVS